VALDIRYCTCLSESSMASQNKCHTTRSKVSLSPEVSKLLMHFSVCFDNREVGQWLNFLEFRVHKYALRCGAGASSEHES